MAESKKEEKVHSGSFDNDYQLAGLMGKGGYGYVYRAIRQSDNQEVAVKVGRTDTKKSILVINQQIETEAELLNNLKHDNITQLLGEIQQLARARRNHVHCTRSSHRHGPL